MLAGDDGPLSPQLLVEQPDGSLGYAFDGARVSWISTPPINTSAFQDIDNDSSREEGAFGRLT